MPVKQLFTQKVPQELVLKVLSLFGLKGLKDKKEFNILDMDKRNVLTNFILIQPEIMGYYLKCKHRFFDNIDNKGIITIFKQLLRAHDYDLQSREKFIKATKYLLYHIVSKSEKEKPLIPESDYKLLLIKLKIKDIDLDYLIENHFDFIKEELSYYKKLEKQ